MGMQVIEINSQEKAERIIHSGSKTHRMHWQKYYSNKTKYLIFYYPKEV